MSSKIEKEIKTGTIVNINEKNLEVLETHMQERKNLSWLIEEAATKGRLCTDNFWNTVYDLYPDLKGFDIHINWKEKFITVRGQKK